jgi:hypothetical protein
MFRLVAAFLILSTPAIAESGPDISLIHQCIVDAQSRDNCTSVALESVRALDRMVGQAEARVIVEVNMSVYQPFAGCSPAAVNCTGTCWNMDPQRVQSTPGMFDSSFFLVGQRLQVRKTLVFQKWESGWRCATSAMKPVDAAFYPRP